MRNYNFTPGARTLVRSNSPGQQTLVPSNWPGARTLVRSNPQTAADSRKLLRQLRRADGPSPVLFCCQLNVTTPRPIPEFPSRRSSQVFLLEGRLTGQVSVAEGRLTSQVSVPEGPSTIAQGFNLGWAHQERRVPKGRLNRWTIAESRPATRAYPLSQSALQLQILAQQPFDACCGPKSALRASCWELESAGRANCCGLKSARRPVCPQPVCYSRSSLIN